MNKWTLGQAGKQTQFKANTNPNQTQFKLKQTQFQRQKMLLRLTIIGGSAGTDLLDVLAEGKKVMVKVHFYQRYFNKKNPYNEDLSSTFNLIPTAYYINSYNLCDSNRLVKCSAYDWQQYSGVIKYNCQCSICQSYVRSTMILLCLFLFKKPKEALKRKENEAKRANFQDKYQALPIWLE